MTHLRGVSETLTVHSGPGEDPGEEQAHAYVPMDRRHALDRRSVPPQRRARHRVRGRPLRVHRADRDAGGEFGEQRGAEQLALRLNLMYDGLIHEVHRFGGTVLGFAGTPSPAGWTATTGCEPSAAPSRSNAGWPTTPKMWRAATSSRPG